MRLAPLLVALLAVATAAHAATVPKAGSASASTLTLPSGPGSIQGLADLGAIDVFSGQVQHLVPLPLPPGRGGAGPAMALAYSGALGNGPIGLGWTLGVPMLRRSTRHGVPAFTSQDELELAGLAASGRLIKVPGGYRLEGAGDGIWITETDGGFLARQADGTTHRFESPHSDPEAAERVTAWALSRSESIHGESIEYAWMAHLGQLYLASVRWGPERAGGARRYHATFTYGARPDGVISYREGFRVVTARRLEQVQITIEGVVRNTVHLDYLDETLPSPELPLSRLRSVRVTGLGGDGEAPPMRYIYGGAFTPSYDQPSGLVGYLPGQRGVTLLDVDGDGLTDLARFDLGLRTWRRNRGPFGGPQSHFEPERPLPGGDLRHLDDVRLLDLTGDGRPEVVYRVGREWQVLTLFRPPGGGPGDVILRPLSKAPWPGATDLPLDDPRVAFGDLDGDGRTDVLQALGSGLRVVFGTAAGFGTPRMRPLPAAGGGVFTPGDSRVELIDHNGDGLADLVFWGTERLLVLDGRGDGRFAAPRTLTYPGGFELTGNETLRLVDLNRDGLLDLVHVGGYRVTLYSGQPGGFSASATARLDTPAGQRPDDLVTFGDLNGNGSTDVVWSTQGGLVVLDLVGPTTQGVLTAIENGLGGRQRFVYRSSAAMAQEAERAGQSWTTFPRAPHPLPWRQLVETGHPGDPARITAFKVADGAHDDDERRFAGYRLSWATTLADPDRPSEQVVVETEYELGLGLSRVLRGKPFRVATWDGLGRRLAEVVTVHDAVPVAGLPPSEPLLRRAVVLETLTDVYEGQTTPLTTRTTHEHDDRGRVIRTVSEGRLDLDGDEVVTERNYASNDETGVHDVVCGERVRELDGTVRRYSRTHYDSRPSPASVQGCDPDGEPLCACTVTTGLVVATDAWLGPVDLPETSPESGRWVRQSETDYSDFALPTRQRSGGVERTFTYDADLLHPLTETVAGPSDLTWTATWNETLDLIASVSDPTGLETALTYDALGRVIARVGPLPDGTPDVLEEYEYVTDPITSAGGPGPHVIARRHEYGAADDGLSVTAVNGLGEPRYTVTFTATTGTTAGPWLVSGYRERNRLGLTTRLVSPFATEVDPREAAAPAPPEGHPSQTLVYDAQRRVIEHHLPPTPSLPNGVTQIASVGRFTVSTGQTWTYQGPTGAPVAMSGALSTVESDGLGRAIVATRLVTGAPEETEIQETVYDAAGAILTEDLQEGRVVRTFVTDTLGRLRRASDPDSGVRLWTWDDDGRLVASENGESDRIEYEYDTAGRLTSRRLLSATLEELSSFRYDTPLSGCTAGEGGGLGRLLGVTLDLVESGTPTERLETTCWSFGPDGRQSRSTRDLLGKTLSTESTFSPSGLVLASTLADDDTDRLTLSQSFDAASRLLRVDVQRPGLDEDPALLWAATGYDENGALRAEQLGSGAGTAYERDALGLVTRLRVGDAVALTPVVGAGASPGAAADLEAALWDLPPPAVRLDLGVRYDGIGAPVDVTDFASSTGLDQTARYAYDPAGRLVGAALASGPSPLTFTYSYDALQNLTSRTASGSVGGLVARLGTYSYGGTAHPRRLVSAAGLALGYDDAGRTTSYGDWDQSFDADDRIRTISRPGLDPLSYQYGADGERIASWEDDVLTERRFGPSLLHRPVEGELQLYLQVGDRPVARIDLPDEVPSSATPLDVRYLHKGVSAGPVLVTGADAALLEERIYEPYGALLEVEGPGGDEPYGWLNKPVDPNTLWTDHGARWYSPEIARWLSSDPLSWAAPMEQLPFAYVSGAPTLLWDPDGRDANSSFEPPDDSDEWAEDGIPAEYSNHVSMSYDTVDGRLVETASWCPSDCDARGTNVISPIYRKDIGPSRARPTPRSRTTGERDLASLQESVQNDRLNIKDRVEAERRNGTGWAGDLTVLTWGVIGIGKGGGGKDVATKGGGETFEIVDGVRRAKAAQLAGKNTIKAEVQVGGKVVGTREIPLDQLRSPHKSAIDVTTSQSGWARWKSVLDGTKAGDPIPPILVQPGTRGVSIWDVFFK